MEHYLKENFVVDAKSPSEEALRRWRSAVAVVRNPRRRFRMVADLAKRAEAERKRKNIQEKIRIALYINKAALQFIEAANRVEHRIIDSVRRQTGFDIGPDELAALARSHDINYLESHGGVEGLGRQVSVSLNDGVVSSDISIRQNIYGFNRYAEKPARSFWIEVGQDETPLQVKLNGVATVIGKIGLAFAVTTFLALLARFLLVKAENHEITKWSSRSEVTKGKDGTTDILGTPTETAILELGLLLGGDFKTHHNESEIVKVEPFNSEKKKMSVLVSLPDNGRFRAFCKGASEIILKMCDKMLTADGKAVPLSEKKRQKITDVINGFSCEALRTLCLAFKDMENTSGAINYGLVIEGADFRCKSPQELEEIIPKLQVMARSSPSDKHKLVTQLRSVFKEVVAVTGDGTNDAPALAEADIGLAMGIAGTEVLLSGSNSAFFSYFLQVAKESADVIVMDDNFKTIVNVARWGDEPLTTVQLLWVNLIMDTLGALALATEPPHDGLMKRPPIGRDVSIITKTMWRNIIGQSIYQISVLVILQFDGKHLLKLSGSDDTKTLNTFIFNTFVFCQVFNEINSRDMEKINVFKGIFSSWVFLTVMFSTVTFQIVIVEFLGTYANTVPLRWELWLASVLIGAASLVIAVILKCIPVETNKDDSTVKHHDGYEPLPSGPDMA
ncbi:hypothetical protein DKX38_005139 [Salix brachista]|uniref:Cation-transporting P-type ATPase C-terminal domain-containing protein n=1 Tax=Salix brachista TaxID=2182728 RepID=A0A5N5NBU4_9ROSI|nr:hypothetical protein DKX38_005139 [Salix brachista]